MRNKDKS